MAKKFLRALDDGCAHVEAFFPVCKVQLDSAQAPCSIGMYMYKIMMDIVQQSFLSTLMMFRVHSGA